MSTYTHGHAEAVLRSHRWRTAANSAAYLLPHLHDGQRLLDVGSGPGTITADLARLVREVVALEVDDQAAALTRAELDRQGVTNATVVVGDVHDLDVDGLGGVFDVVHAHQVLQHVADPVGALREMRRVCAARRARRRAGQRLRRRSPGTRASAALERLARRSIGRVARRPTVASRDAGRRRLHAWARARRASPTVIATVDHVVLHRRPRTVRGGAACGPIASLAIRTSRGRRSTSGARHRRRAAADRRWLARVGRGPTTAGSSVLHGEVVITA